MLCRAVLPLERSRRALFVPKDAVVDDGRERVVFRIEAGVARRTPVRRGAADGDRVEVEGELENGQQVVVRGNERLQDGQPVQVLEEFGRRPADGDAGERS
jgi:multidrug efflux pump subunit AcrA (membrane-fusion protein)